ncbi:unnamed protein product [Peronospora belbahrii]|uniref:Uncharacterized protein n=1 Tax=Peronospora belbahrii TaxID=622444 RepID=A0ABN8D549_9STRA|nr:unnamed protein product [Peronospora belbahrii]
MQVVDSAVPAPVQAAEASAHVAQDVLMHEMAGSSLQREPDNRARRGPRPRTVSDAAPVLPVTRKEEVAAPAVRRPLTPAASGTRATRWGPCHRAIGITAGSHTLRSTRVGDGTACRSPFQVASPAPDCAAPNIASVSVTDVPADDVPADNLPDDDVPADDVPDDDDAPDDDDVPDDDVPDDDVPDVDVPVDDFPVSDVPAAGVPAASIAPAFHVDATPPASPSPKGPRGSVLPPDAAVAIDPGVPEPWVLRFDGACRLNPGSGGAGAALFAPSGTVPLTPTPSAPSASPTPACSGASAADDVMEVDDDEAAVAADIAARDGGEVYPTLPIGPGSAPARQPRLRLRPLGEEEQKTAANAFQAVVEGVAS